MLENQLRITSRAIISDSGRILMCWNQKDELFFLPGGGLEPDERAQACLIRELQEELAFDAEIEAFLGILEIHYQFQSSAYQQFDLIFRVQTPTGMLDGPVSTQEAHLDFQVVSINDLPSMPTFPSNLAAFVSDHQQGTTYLFEQWAR